MLVSGLRRGVLELELLELKPLLLLPLLEVVVDSDEELNEDWLDEDWLDEDCPNEELLLLLNPLSSDQELSIAEVDLVVFMPPSLPLLYLA